MIFIKKLIITPLSIHTSNIYSLISVLSKTWLRFKVIIYTLIVFNFDRGFWVWQQMFFYLAGHFPFHSVSKVEIIADRRSEGSQFPQHTMTNDPNKIWPNEIIPYEFDSRVGMRSSHYYLTLLNIYYQIQCYRKAGKLGGTLIWQVGD